MCASENLFRLNPENLGFQGPLHKVAQEKTPSDRQSTSLRLNVVLGHYF